MSNICHLFRLSAELRNDIYAYALPRPSGVHFSNTEHDGWHLVRSSPFFSARYQTSQAANQLQFVNHQLRVETRHLSSRYNDIIFATLSDLLLFKELCPTNQFRHLRRVRVTEPGPFSIKRRRLGKHISTPLDESNPVIKFCIENAHLTVECQVRHWNQRSTDFVPFATYAQIRVRKKATLLYEFVTCALKALGILEKASRGFAACPSLPSNLVLFPEDTMFNEFLFRMTYTAEDWSDFNFGAYVDGGIDRWVATARGIYEHGL
jgi:hypothetical protein